jgi:hypothetical protein
MRIPNSEAVSVGFRCGSLGVLQVPEDAWLRKNAIPASSQEMKMQLQLQLQLQWQLRHMIGIISTAMAHE